VKSILSQFFRRRSTRVIPLKQIDGQKQTTLATLLETKEQGRFPDDRHKTKTRFFVDSTSEADIESRKNRARDFNAEAA
jgi:hypothetical protein